MDNPYKLEYIKNFGAIYDTESDIWIADFTYPLGTKVCHRYNTYNALLEALSNLLLHFEHLNAGERVPFVDNLIAHTHEVIESSKKGASNA